MPKILATIILVLSVMLFPPAVLAFISQNAIPGESLYPVKRKLEQGLLLIAATHPNTKALFSTNLSSRRFNETKVLIAKGDSEKAITSVDELVIQTSTTTSEIKKIPSVASKKGLAKEFKKSLKEYNQELTKTSQKLNPSKRETTVNNEPRPTPTPRFQTQTDTKKLEVKIDEAIKKIDDLDKELDKEIAELTSDGGVAEGEDLEDIFNDLEDNDLGELESLLNRMFNQYNNVFP